MDYYLNARDVNSKIYPCPVEYTGVDPAGNRIDFTNYYMRYNGKPYYAVSGEMHFSRIDMRSLEDEIIKMKMAGITMISTYLFWIHHEEVKGQFDWKGNKNLREFLSLCKKQGIFVLLRLGPFSHGECRNGGLPDWLFGVPFDIRSNDEEYLFYVKRYFNEIGNQAKGFMFKDGGPVVSIQIENEYEHASSPWEPTTENSGEWTPSGNDGPSHFKELKKIALEAGLIAPLYSTTAWGGACAPVEYVMPLWGGYPFWPWIFYGDDIKEHPATTEFIYKDFHNNDAPKYYNFDPIYPPEDFPFVCCEMGGGMASFYRYRFKLPWASVEALANIKAASGCNFLGYYMYHGGTNPKGLKVPYLNECALPKVSYDYQAAIGEYGQIRESFKRSKLLHYFYKDFEAVFCDTKTVLPDDAKDMKPDDMESLRYSIRVNKGRGFLFLNNYQDHAETRAKEDFSIAVELSEGKIRVPEEGALCLDKDASAVLPLNQDLDGVTVRYATVQPVTRLQKGDEIWYFFCRVRGMKPEICVEGNDPVKFSDTKTEKAILKGKDGRQIMVCVLSVEDSLRFWRIKLPGGDLAFLCDQTMLEDAGNLRIESIGSVEGEIAVFPARESISINDTSYKAKRDDGIFSYFDISYGKNNVSLSWEDASSKAKDSDGALRRPVIGSPITSTKITNARAKIKIDPASFDCCKQVLLRVEYTGDIGYAYTDTELVSDNFCNGDVWEFGLREYRNEVLEKGIHIYISPRRKGGKVCSDSEMAARFAVYDESYAEISGISAIPVFDCRLVL
ncbi:beta-galactosidase [Treponema primitia ZAS-2]|uniref:Beta-galactosidase n=1 Tax=Treponema primitia (strain ATCC BAA-887 / DSM 12427 / ZAS-2) TaxID=545694 RepID=F5YNJ7_TREPZ|nr:beta-galactosidase [Treponema primitia]AEF84788.1 beta-galactosidase [Treponema primitia ZAS-2]